MQHVTFLKKWMCLLVTMAFLSQAQEIIPVKDIKPGMVGYGLSVFRGNNIERFQVQVIEVLEGFMPGESYILVRCSPAYGGYDIDRSGLIAGMSGSPIYLENKLAGALAMGWAFAKEPLAGITPIETMLKITRRPQENKTARADFGSYGPLGGLVPLATPCLVSGATPDTFRKLEEEFGRYGWLPIWGGSGQGKAAFRDYKLEPGSPIGAQLMAGDLSLTAIGTVTWVENDQVLAFGHSFLNAGEMAMPITTAHITAVLENSMISFKLGYPVEPVGMLLQDRLPGIYGKIGRTCPMLPVKVNIKNRLTGADRTFDVAVIKNASLTARLCSIAIFNFLDMQEATWGENTTWVQSRVYMTGESPLEWNNMYADTRALKGDFTGPLQYVYQNPFKVVEIEKIELDVEVAHQLQYAQIYALRADTMELAPGESLDLEVVLQSYREEKKSLRMAMKIPQNLPAGDYTITAMSGGETLPEMFKPENLQQYLDALRKINQYKNNQVVLSLGLPKIKVLCNGREMSDLPGSVLGNLLPANSTRGVQLLPETHCVTANTDYVISGSANLIIKVKEQSQEKK